ncbi:putative phosphothreonine lyase domain-containg protein [Streptomyces sp. NPDC052107]|uniref:putative phosphothreonine lyase domain-containing protein n=1 Tax=Streptomyces TaxID=1883 RepID=UPI003428B1FF
MQTRATRTGHTRTPPLDTPSTVTGAPWLWATAPDAPDPDADEHLAVTAYGKWLWFLPVRALDAGWRTVKTAVEAGQLGPRAKVATLGNSFDGDPTRRPVVIYTVNHHDEDDVRRVLVALRALGIHDSLAYKTDEATEHGEYGDGTSIYTSPAGTTKVIRRDRNPG